MLRGSYPETVKKSNMMKFGLTLLMKIFKAGCKNVGDVRHVEAEALPVTTHKPHLN